MIMNQKDNLKSSQNYYNFGYKMMCHNYVNWFVMNVKSTSKKNKRKEPSRITKWDIHLFFYFKLLSFIHHIKLLYNR